MFLYLQFALTACKHNLLSRWHLSLPKYRGCLHTAMSANICLAVLALSVRLASPIWFHQLVQRLGQVSEDAGSSLKFLVEHPTGLPVHSTTQIMADLKRILHNHICSALTSQQAIFIDAFEMPGLPLEFKGLGLAQKTPHFAQDGSAKH